MVKGVIKSEHIKGIGQGTARLTMARARGDGERALGRLRGGQVYT